MLQFIFPFPQSLARAGLFSCSPCHPHPYDFSNTAISLPPPPRHIEHFQDSGISQLPGSPLTIKEGYTIFPGKVGEAVNMILFARVSGGYQNKKALTDFSASAWINWWAIGDSNTEPID
jgi:hypothetical protein